MGLLEVTVNRIIANTEKLVTKVQAVQDLIDNAESEVRTLHPEFRNEPATGVGFLHNVIIQLLAEREKLRSRVKQTGVCIVCWTDSWVPIESVEFANGVNTRTVEGSSILERCDFCWIVDQFINKRRDR